MKENKRTYHVKQEDRINPLSKQPTNNTIRVVYHGYDKVYDNIHYPTAFAKAIMSNDVKQIPDPKEHWVAMFLNEEPWGENENHPLIEEYRKSKNESE